MCGIAGSWGNSDTFPVEQMLKLLIHRGPDASGIYKSGNIVMGHRRLSIMDPAGGNQPIPNEDNSTSIIANGEIYNYPKLKNQIVKRHKLKTKSDTEPVLHLYEDLGPSSVEKLDGMFAFAISDGNDVFLARDPVGIKPLYFSRVNGTITFASELKALAKTTNDINEFPPGSYYHSGEGLKRYYEMPDRHPKDSTLNEHIRALKSTLTESVTKRLMSDVSLGAFLSGGLDSSIIAAIVREYAKDLHTFSVGTEGSSDIEAARRVSSHLGTIHHEYIFTPEEVIEKLPEIIYHLESFDQDLVRSAIPCYFTSRLASDYVKVILTGEGADELFAGYNYYKQFSSPESLHKELRRSVQSLHNINLQRVDRLTMAHSIEGRVPFLDLSMIEAAQTIPAKYKLYNDPNGNIIEKWILRKAFEGMLPDEILWRRKEQFDEGSGTADIISCLIESKMDMSGLENYRLRHNKTRLRSAEECYYHKIFMDVFAPNGEKMLQNVARWSLDRRA